jgi:hypothetical protein
VLRLQPVKKERRVGTSDPQNSEEVGLLLGVMEALGKGVNVVDHRLEHIEIRLGATIPDFADEIEHPVKHCPQRPVLIVNDANCLHVSPALCRPTD